MPGFRIQTKSGDCGPENACDDGYTGPDPNVETVRKHRYHLRVLEPMQSVRLYAHKCQRPVCEVDRIVMHHGQDEIYKPGKSRWLPIEIVFYETVGEVDNTALYLSRWWGRDMVDIRNSTLAGDTSYKKDCELELVDGCGSPVWVYYLYQVWPSKVSPSELSYADTELAEIACTLEIGKAVERAR